MDCCFGCTRQIRSLVLVALSVTIFVKISSPHHLDVYAAFANHQRTKIISKNKNYCELRRLFVDDNESDVSERPAQKRKLEVMKTKSLRPVLVGILFAAELTMALTIISPVTYSCVSNAASIVSIDEKDNNGNDNHHLSKYENYIPRKLYPGTYKNFCGPTPEITIKDNCKAHGWHGDEPLDVVDEACMIHDITYCKCETELFSRQTREAGAEMRSVEDEDQPILSSVMALRFVIPKPIFSNQMIMKRSLGGLVLDKEYFQCVDKADRKLISTGIEIRSDQQRNHCSNESKRLGQQGDTEIISKHRQQQRGDNHDTDSLNWFCNVPGDGSVYINDDTRNYPFSWNTLTTFEKVNLSIFLKSLDSDEKEFDRTITVLDNSGHHKLPMSLYALEEERRKDLMYEIKINGKSLSDAVSSSSVQKDEEQMLLKLVEK